MNAAAAAAAATTTTAAAAAEGKTQQPASMSPCDVEALKRCLAEHKGDHRKCEAEVLAFKRACSREGGSSGGRSGGGSNKQ